MGTELQQLLLEEVQKHCDFLRPKFKGPLPQWDAKLGYFFKVVFLGNNLAVEFTLDERDEDISCYISRVINGQPVAYFAIDPQGRRVRGRLSTLLLARGIRSRLFTRVTSLPLKDRIPIVIGDYARMLKTYGQMVLDDCPEFLDVEE